MNIYIYTYTCMWICLNLCVSVIALAALHIFHKHWLLQTMSNLGGWQWLAGDGVPAGLNGWVYTQGCWSWGMVITWLWYWLATSWCWNCQRNLGIMLWMWQFRRTPWWYMIGWFTMWHMQKLGMWGTRGFPAGLLIWLAAVCFMADHHHFNVLPWVAAYM